MSDWAAKIRAGADELIAERNAIYFKHHDPVHSLLRDVLIGIRTSHWDTHWLEMAIERCESPLETAWLAMSAIYLSQRDYAKFWVGPREQVRVWADERRSWACDASRFADPSSPYPASSKTNPNGYYSVAVYPQIKLGRYRADFLIVGRVQSTYRAFDHNNEPRLDAPVIKTLVVECDGHDFHERTKEQAQHDRARDRAMQAAGHTVYRFTGSELWANPLRCVQQTFSDLERLVRAEFDDRIASRQGRNANHG